MSKTKIIATLMLLISLAGNIYYFGGKIYQEHKTELIQQGRTEATNQINQNILSKILVDGKMTAIIPYTDNEGEGQKLEVLIINVKLLDKE